MQKVAAAFRGIGVSILIRPNPIWLTFIKIPSYRVLRHTELEICRALKNIRVGCCSTEKFSLSSKVSDVSIAVFFLYLFLKEKPSPYQSVTFQNKNYFLLPSMTGTVVLCFTYYTFLHSILPDTFCRLLQSSPTANSIANSDKYMDFEASL